MDFRYEAKHILIWKAARNEFSESAVCFLRIAEAAIWI